MIKIATDIKTGLIIIADVWDATVDYELQNFRLAWPSLIPEGHKTWMHSPKRAMKRPIGGYVKESKDLHSVCSLFDSFFQFFFVQAWELTTLKETSFYRSTIDSVVCFQVDSIADRTVHTCGVFMSLIINNHFAGAVCFCQFHYFRLTLSSIYHLSASTLFIY